MTSTILTQTRAAQLSLSGNDGDWAGPTNAGVASEVTIGATRPTNAPERWAFKTTCSATYLLREEVGDWKPPAELARFAFGVEVPPNGVGLAVLGDVGDQVDFKDEQAFSFVTHKGSRAVGGSLMRFRGLTLLCSWAQKAEALMPLNIDHLGGRTAMWHPNEYNRIPENVAVRFDWSDKFKPERSLLKLRSRYPGVGR